MDSPWDRQKDYWLLFLVTDRDLLSVIEHYIKKNPKDAQTVLWLSSRGNHGSDCGGTQTEEVACHWGGFVDRSYRNEVTEW